MPSTKPIASEVMHARAANLWPRLNECFPIELLAAEFEALRRETANECAELLRDKSCACARMIRARFAGREG